MTTKETIHQVAEQLGITMSATFIPWSLSRNAGEDNPSLNYKVSLSHKGRVFIETDYSMGMGHAPSYKQGRLTVDEMNRIKNECEKGYKAIGASRAILPVLASVLSSLVSDASAIDYDSFEQWASDCGYDTDSRSAESIYRASVEIGLKLRNALGEDGLNTLRDALQNY